MFGRKTAVLTATGAAFVGLSLLIDLPSAVAAKNCTDLEEGVRAAVRAAEPGIAVEAYREAEQTGACDGLASRLMGRNVAYAFLARAAATSEGAREGLFRQGLGYGRPWQVVAALADIEKERKAYDKATALYQEALDDIADEAVNPRAPPVDVIASIYKKAEETRLLAPRYVARVDRNGDPSGLARRKFRGFVARRTAVPIHFEYDKTEFTAEGRKAAEDMLRYLRHQGTREIRLIGHTDPRGSEPYNLSLSKRRAEAVKAFLRESGFEGRIRTSGLGESRAFQPDDPGSYSQEELWQLDRRVEIER